MDMIKLVSKYYIHSNDLFTSFKVTNFNELETNSKENHIFIKLFKTYITQD